MSITDHVYSEMTDGAGDACCRVCFESRLTHDLAAEVAALTAQRDAAQAAVERVRAVAESWPEWWAGEPVPEISDHGLGKASCRRDIRAALAEAFPVAAEGKPDA